MQLVRSQRLLSNLSQNCISITITTAGLVLGGSMLAGIALADGQSKYPNSVSATRHMVSSAHPLASKAGLNVLENNGTAMDAAVAVQMMLNLVEPESSGIGGGAFLLYWDNSEQKLITYDGRESTCQCHSGIFSKRRR